MPLESVEVISVESCPPFYPKANHVGALDIDVSGMKAGHKIILQTPDGVEVKMTLARAFFPNPGSPTLFLDEGPVDRLDGFHAARKR